MEIFKEFLIKTGIGIKEYIKATLISSFVSFIVCLVGLAIGNVPYYGLIALGLAILDLIPVVGSGIVLVPWAIISVLSSNTKLALILILLFIVSFVLDQILEPLILGKTIGLKPLYTLLITSIAMLILGPAIGAIVGALISIILSVIIDMKSTQSMDNRSK